jgi:hypothetical protein
VPRSRDSEIERAVIRAVEDAMRKADGELRGVGGYLAGHGSAAGAVGHHMRLGGALALRKAGLSQVDLTACWRFLAILGFLGEVLPQARGSSASQKETVSVWLFGAIVEDFLPGSRDIVPRPGHFSVPHYHDQEGRIYIWAGGPPEAAAGTLGGEGSRVGTLRVADLFVLLPPSEIRDKERFGVRNEFPRPGEDLQLTLNTDRFTGPLLQPLSESGGGAEAGERGSGATTIITGNVTALQRQKGRMATARIGVTIKTSY